MKKTIIRSLSAIEALSDENAAAVLVSVTTEAGITEQAIYGEGLRFGEYYNNSLLDEDINRYHGKGMKKAVEIINKYVAPALIGMDADNQSEINKTIVETLNRNNIPCYVNITSPVSFATMKSAAASLGIPLFRYVGGARAYKVPLPEWPCASGGNRYSDNLTSKGRPYYAFVPYNFETFEDAYYSLWVMFVTWIKVVKDHNLKFNNVTFSFYKGSVKNDEEILYLMDEAIELAGYKGKMGIHVDYCASAFYDASNNTYSGLISESDMNKAELLNYHLDTIERHPNIVFIEEPFEANDLNSYQQLTEKSDIQIGSSDIYGNDFDRLEEILSSHCINSVGIRPHSFLTFADCINVSMTASKHNVSTFVVGINGEDYDAIDFATGLHSGLVYMSNPFNHSSRMVHINDEIGPQSTYVGTTGLNGKRFNLKKEETK